MRLRFRAAFGLLLAWLALAAALAVLTFSPGGQPPGEAGQVECVVSRVYDGDTIEADGFGRVRLIGIDALDAHNERKTQAQAVELGLSEASVRRWAARGTERARQLLEGREVSLRFGPERRDDYGRLLAYVYFSRDGQQINFNHLMLEEGLAVATRTFTHPDLREFLKVEARARRNGAGLWKEAQPTR